VSRARLLESSHTRSVATFAFDRSDYVANGAISGEEMLVTYDETAVMSDYLDGKYMRVAHP
jgi:hypothetical protein